MTKERIKIVLNNMSLSKEDKNSLFKLFIELIDNNKSSYTKEEIDDKFVNKETLNNDYINKTDIENNYVSKEYIKNTYLTKTNITNTYITKTDVNKTYATKTELNNKQATLVSGTNIKTINGESLLGSGDIVIPIQS